MNGSAYGIRTRDTALRGLGEVYKLTLYKVYLYTFLEQKLTLAPLWHTLQRVF